jgi:diacylglycerol diphosphate phosphatase/phosphatidate phosphatase
MGFFNRRQQAPVAADTTTATGTTHHEKKGGVFGRKESRVTSRGSPSWNSRPTFGQWIKATALDIVTMAVMGAIGLGVYMADPAPSRSFPITFSDGEIVYPEFAYPLRNEVCIRLGLLIVYQLISSRSFPSGLLLSWPSSFPSQCS